MIHRTHRFHGRGSLRFVYQRGLAVRGVHSSLKYIRNNRIQTYRAAVVVSRKVSKSAVVRNRIRRRMYEVLREFESYIQDPYDLVFIIYSDDLASLDHKTLRAMILTQLKKAGVIDVKRPPRTDSHDIVEVKEKN